VAGMVMLLAAPAGIAGASPTAATLYQEAIATTKGWTVHYVSTSTSPRSRFSRAATPDRRRAPSRSVVGKGSTLDVALLIVIGDLTFIRGNKLAMEDLTGLCRRPRRRPP
jgi:hypothetical protein